MRGWVLEQQAPIEERPLQLLEVPTPRPREVRARISVCGICRTDLHVEDCQDAMIGLRLGKIRQPNAAVRVR
jgi:D-arabinose 1-dehydrogenase-like Zn-dependent alcohol dehydrogenase